MSATVSPDTTRNLAAYIAGLCGETLPADVDRMARLCLMDWIGCAVAGASLRGSRVIREVLTQSAAAGRSTIVGGDCALDAAAAALHNGYASHALEFDDTHPGSFAHISAPVFAAAVAVGEDLDVSLSDLIGAFVAGYETMARVGLPIGAKMFKVYHVHPTGFLGYLGAAAAAGKLLGLSEGQLAMALGIAGTQAGGLLESVGTMSEGYCASHPSSGGLTAARLAAAGFEGTPAILNGDAGIFAAFGAPRDLDLVNDDGFEIRRNEFKMYPSCGFTHPMLDALLELRREIPDGMPWDQVTVKVRLWTPAADLVDRPGPRTGPEARFSAQFCAAVALIDGVAGPDQFADDRTRDPEVLALMKAVEIVRDDQLNRHQSNVVIEAAGDAWEHFATNEGREVDEGRLVDKFVGLTAPLYGQGDASRMAKTILTSTACKVSTLLTPARRSSR